MIAIILYGDNHNQTTSIACKDDCVSQQRVAHGVKRQASLRRRLREKKKRKERERESLGGQRESVSGGRESHFERERFAQERLVRERDGLSKRDTEGWLFEEGYRCHFERDVG